LLPGEPSLVGAVVFTAVSILLYVAVGGPSLLFPILCAAGELAWRRRYILGPLFADRYRNSIHRRLRLSLEITKLWLVERDRSNRQRPGQWLGFALSLLPSFMHCCVGESIRRTYHGSTVAAFRRHGEGLLC